MAILRPILLIWVVFAQIMGLVQKLATMKVAALPRGLSLLLSSLANFCIKSINQS